MPIRFIHTLPSRRLARSAMALSAALLLLLTPGTGSSATVPARTGHQITLPVFLAATSSRTLAVPTPAVETSDSEGPSPPLAAQSRTPDWNGVWRDTGIIFSTQFVVGGIIYVMPESVSSWNSEQKKKSFKKYAENFVQPAIDKDKFYINYIIHPYWGSTYYTRARERGLDKGASFLYSTLLSTMFEFGAECFFERPSIQDLIVTPVAGSLLGAYLFEPWRESIKRKQELRWYDHAALIATDPIGVLSSGCERLFGVKPAITVDFSIPDATTGTSGSARTSEDRRIRVVLQFPID